VETFVSSQKPSEELRRRFLVGDVTDQEREEIEARFMADPSFFEELTANDDELLLAHARGELAAPLRDQLHASLAASPVRRRRYEEMQALSAAASMMRAETAAEESSHTTAAARRGWRPFILLAAAAVLVATLTGTWVLRQVDREPDAGRQGAPDQTARLETFVLTPGTPRDPGAPINMFRVSPGTTIVGLRLTLPGSPPTSPQATIEPVRNPPLVGRFDLEVQPGAHSSDVIVRVPAERLPPGDYLVTITAIGSGGAREVVGRRLVTFLP
jgi:hypothetical protein